MGLNLYAYAGNNPISGRDPFGLSPGNAWLYDLAHVLSDFSSCAGSALTFGGTDLVNDLTGASSVVNKCSVSCFAGTITGTVVLIGITAGEGAEGEAVEAELRGPQTWQESEEWLNAKYGGEPQVRFDTSLGPRTIDNFTDEGILQEAKSGYTDLTESIERQIDKEIELVNTPGNGVNSAEWHFFESSVSGIGPSPSLINALQEGVIKIFVHIF